MLICLVTVSNVSIINSRNRVLLNLTPNSFPAARYSARRDAGDDSPIEYIQVRTSVFDNYKWLTKVKKKELTE